MSEHLKPGEVVDITIKGARVERAGIEGHDDDTTPVVQVAITNPDGRSYFTTLPTQWAPVTVERATPAEWPPRPGDLWRDRTGDLFFVMEAQRGHLLMNGTDGGRDGPEYVATQYGPLTLVHREDEQDGGAS